MRRLNKLKFFILTAIFFIIFSASLVTISVAQEEYDMYGYTAPWALWGLTGALCLIPFALFILWIVLAIWVYKDAEKRDSSGVLWLIIVLFIGIIGLIIWLIVRPPIGGKKEKSIERRCPNCGRVIPDDARVCPYCSKKFEE